MQHLPQHTLSFNQFTLDLSRGCLLRGSEEIKLRPKSFETLKHLVENSGRLISKSELMSVVWPDTSVTDDSLVQCLIEVRRALGEGGHEMVRTVPRRGYIFEAQVTRSDPAERSFVDTDEIESVSLSIEGKTREGWSATSNSSKRSVTTSKPRFPTKVGIGASVLIALVALSAWTLWRKQPKVTPTGIRTLAVLPFRSQIPGEEDYLGIGIANEIITKVNQTGTITVRPTSAIRRYTNQDVDALHAARELQVDAVLDGTYLRVGDQLRVTVNLLRVSDGASLWAEKFDQKFTDIFAIQDRVSQQVTQRLWLKLSPAEQVRLNKRYTSNPLAYSYYAKAMYHFYNIGPNNSSRSESDLAIDLFKKAIELDPSYALAHAQLGYAYTKVAVFQEDNPALIEQAKQELGIAERLDPQLAEVHVARYFISFSQYERWSVENASRELRLARELDPSVGHPEMLDLYAHIGLEDEAAEEFEVALQVDPNNEEVKNFYLNSLFISARPDEYLEASRRLFNREPDLRYFLEKRQVKEAEVLAEEEYKKNPDAVWVFTYRVLLKALQGKHAEAQAAIPAILARERGYRGYHHDTYNIARIYALGGKSDKALKWLHKTVAEGFPHYPLFARDPFLNPIRDDRSFIQFLEEIKTKWEAYKKAFG